MNICFSTPFPKHLKKDVLATLKPYLSLVDTKLDEISVEFCPQTQENSEEVVAAVLTQREYKQIRLGIFPKYLTLDEREQEGVLVHELVHVLTAHLRDECYRILEYYVPDPNVRNYCAEIISDREELTVTEVAKALVDFRRGEA